MENQAVKTVCPYCGVGCGMVLHVENNTVVRVEGDPGHPANRGRLCTKGKSAHVPLTHSARLKGAFLREARGRDLVPRTVDEAVALAAKKLRGIVDVHGPDAVSFYVSGQMSLEAQYLITKLAKGFIGTNRIESNSRLCMASAGSGYVSSLGADGPPGSYDDFDHADLFLVIGSNMADCHPVLFLRMMERVKAGARLIVVDPRRTATAEKADLFLQIRPGTDLALLNGLLHLLHAAGKTDQAFIEAFTEGWDVMPAFLADYPPDRVAALTGLAQADVCLAAQWIGEAAEFTSCWAMGLNQSTHGVWHTNALCNLHLATGKICRRGSGPFSLTGQPNAMGGREMGYMGPGLPGQRTVLNAGDRRFAAAVWGVPEANVRDDPGQGTVDLFSRMADGEIKACWIIGTNPAVSMANRQRVIAGLEKAELVIVQEAFLDAETARFADVLLPGALWAEGDGVMVNSERTMTLAPRAVDPPGQACSDWQLIARMAQAMGYGPAFSFASAHGVFEEIRQFSNPLTGYDLSGVSHASLRDAPQQWPCAATPTPPSARNPIRYVSPGRTPGIVFPTPSGKARFHARAHGDPAELPTADYPLVLTTGRLQHQWHTLTKTGRVPTLNKLNPGPFVEIHPDDAKALGIARGDRVQIRSRRGVAVLPAELADTMARGNCFAPMHWNDAFGENLCINAVTNDAVDPVSRQPELKFSAVALSRVAPPPAAVVEEHGSPLSSLAGLLRLPETGVPVLSDQERTYFSGYLSGLQLKEHAVCDEVPVLPSSAPLSPHARLWLDGMLAGIYSRSQALAHSVDYDPLKPAPGDSNRLIRSRPKVVLLWASQTGNIESLTERYATSLMNAGAEIRMACMADYAVGDLSRADYVLLMASTFGDGDPPDNGAGFWKALQACESPLPDSMRYAVLAFGDRLYDDFCGYGRCLDARFEALGATRLLPRQECDVDYLAAADQWLDQVIKRIKHEEEQRHAKAQGGAPLRHVLPTRNRPVTARVELNRRLNGDGASKDTRHLALATQGLNLEYDVGDALGVWPRNCPELVRQILALCGLGADQPVTVGSANELALGEALTAHFDLTRLHPDTLRRVAPYDTSGQLVRLLRDEGKARLKDWLWGRQLADVLQEFPLRLAAEELLSFLKPMQPRLYSIASSPLAHPRSIHLTVSTVRFQTVWGARRGVASTFLADRAESADVPVFVQKSPHFRLPVDASVPIIMVGPGTGIAPFRGFLHERQARGGSGANWLFFGEQHAATDFYYRQELEEMLRQGVLSRLDTAFSRDQDRKIYVQDRLREQGGSVWSWLQEGAYFYVCGDATHMAKDVDATLRAIIAHHGGLSVDDADAYVNRLSREKRYVRDVY